MSNNKLEAFFRSFAEADAKLDYKLAHETVGEKLPVISTGSLALDDALSSGGLPKGRLIQYYGAPGSGKTLMTMLAIKEAQLEDPTAQQMFIDAEGTFDPNWAGVLGLDTSKIIVVSGETAVIGRNCFEMVLGVPKEDKKTHEYLGKSKNGLLDQIREGEFNINLIVLDSLGAILPPGEDISAVGKMNMALLARFLTTTFRKLSLELNKAEVPFVVINHKKANMDPYGVDHSFSGGNTYAHFLSANVYFEAVARADAQILDDKEQKIGHTMRATIEKSKFGPYPRKCEFKVNFGIGVVDKHEEIATLALDYNIVNRPNNVMYEYGEQKWKGKDAFSSAIKDNPAFAEELILKISEARDHKWELKRKEQEDKKAENDAQEADIEPEVKKRGRKAKA